MDKAGRLLWKVHFVDDPQQPEHIGPFELRTTLSRQSKAFQLRMHVCVCSPSTASLGSQNGPVSSFAESRAHHYTVDGSSYVTVLAILLMKVLRMTVFGI